MENKTWTRIFIIIVSVAVPVVVAFLFFTPKVETDASWINMLPHFNATINGITSVTLLAGLYFIKKKDIDKHKTSMLVSFTLGALFLVSYVIYHATSDSTLYGDVDGNGVVDEMERVALGGWRAAYLVILLSHILLAIAGLPLVLLALYHALNETFEKHKKVVKFAFPVWLYVSVTGVIVYFMISPYY